MAFLATVVYVALLLSLAKRCTGMIKVLVAMPLYLLYSVLMVAPLFFMIGEYQSEIQASFLSLSIVLVSWGVAVIPSIMYIHRYKIQELRNAGYFVPRG